MIITRLIGGLGNQMFQYAFGKAASLRLNVPLKIDLDYLHNLSSDHAEFVPRKYSLDIFNIPDQLASKEETALFTNRVNNAAVNSLLSKLLGKKRSYWLEPHYHFSDKAKNAPDNVLLEGYWQSSKYFNEAETELRKIFTFRQPVSAAAGPMLQDITQRNSVCVHVRRGDFLINANHGFCGIPYYQQAERIISEKISDPAYYVFSDEIDWCRENMQFLPGATFVSTELAGHKDQDHLRLMAQCKHFIIPNSSFAWWAVWLSGRSNAVVVAPAKWYKPAPDATDIYQPEWIVI
ncbi:MAG: hypothetical protein DI535_10625 [Citrobacter freundii]|nr:MAG: hypothetical protein DI535_10625 [Citrobacter freundii]